MFGIKKYKTEISDLKDVNNKLIVENGELSRKLQEVIEDKTKTLIQEGMKYSKEQTCILQELTKSKDEIALKLDDIQDNKKKICLRIEQAIKDKGELQIELESIVENNKNMCSRVTEARANGEEISLQLGDAIKCKKKIQFTYEKIQKDNHALAIRIDEEMENKKKLEIMFDQIHSEGKKLTLKIEDEEKKGEALCEKLKNVTKINNQLKQQYEEIKLENKKYEETVDDNYENIINVKKIIENLNATKLKLKKEIEEEKNKKRKIKDEIILLEDEVLLQDFGLYTPIYKFATSTIYKDRLKEVRESQKEMIRNKKAASCFTQWIVNNNKRDGQKMIQDNIKQIIRAFNSECEAIVDKVKFSNYESMKQRIQKAYNDLNKINAVNTILISSEYLKLKYDELNLAYEYQVKLQQEKEEKRLLREEQRENEKLIKEIEEKRKEIEKEQNHYNNVLLRITEQISIEKNEERLQLLISKRTGIEQNLLDLDYALKEVDYREANQRAGYVYVISNIGAFGENVYKIGMTRRLEPLDRIDELSNASVPFKFDIHAMIFSDDAPKLETALHNAFANKKVNMMNNRKEFFYVTLQEIEDVVKRNHDETVEFIELAQAQQYRETLQKKKTKK